ncbi:hypothetical protein Q8F55_000455 [Vanrija albida]|uniref:Proteasome assembly chaperone 1 n=1 Tax=Vanrija albida TaxID=181172 RepID=A0ABR3QDD2_9TREE
MLDPIASLKAPPPRYLLESDSSDEEGQGAYPSSSQPRRPAPPAAEVTLSAVPGAPALKPSSVVVGIGQAGAYLVRRAAAPRPALTVAVGPEPAGTVFALGDGSALVALAEPESGAAYALVEAVLGALGAEAWTLVSSYVPAMYIPAEAEPRLPDPPVRFLSSSAAPKGAGLRGYDAPNYVTGVAGAFLSSSAHPASPFHGKQSTLLLLPLPLSMLDPRAVSAALGATTGAAAALDRPAHWTEVDDEPFAALGMGARRAHEAAGDGDDLSGMYM